MNFQKGDLLICIENKVNNPKWHGIPPELNQYYTFRGYYNRTFTELCYVEEIISSIDPANGKEFAHASKWYKKIEENFNIESLMKETEQISVEELI